MPKYGSHRSEVNQESLQKCLDEYNSINNSSTQLELCTKYEIPINTFNYYKNKHNKTLTVKPVEKVEKKPVTKKLVEKKYTKSDRTADWIKSEKKLGNIHDSDSEKDDSTKKLHKPKRRLTLDDFDLHNDDNEFFMFVIYYVEEKQIFIFSNRIGK